MTLEGILATGRPHTMGAVVIDREGEPQNYGSDNVATHTEEAEYMSGLVLDYLSSERGESFKTYVADLGRELVEIQGVGAGDLGDPNIVAAIYKNDIEGIIMSNYEGKSFSERVQDLAQHHDVEEDWAVEYVIAHELGHAAGFDTEAENEAFLGEYFSAQASVHTGEERAKYIALATIAQEREVYALSEGK